MLGKMILKTIRQMARNRARVAMVILAPVIFFTFFGYVFTPQTDNVILSVGVLNNDVGYAEDYFPILPDNYNRTTSNPQSLGHLFSDLLANYTGILTQSQEGSNLLLDIVIYDDEEVILKDLQTQVVSLGIIIPENFTEILLATYNTQYSLASGQYHEELPRFGGNTSLTLMGDPSVSSYQIAISIVSDAFTGFTDQIYGMQVFASQDLIGGNLDFEFVNKGADVSNFHWFAGGFIIFVILLNMISVSGILAEEKEVGTINRIKMSLVPDYYLFLAIIIMQVVVATIQIAISAFFIHMNGVDISFGSWMRVFFILQLANINVTGLGLIIAAFAKTQKDASNITGILVAPLGFLSGSFLPVPEAWLIKSINLQFWDILPSYHAVQAVTKIFLEEVTLSELSREISFLVVLSFAWLVIGLFVYNKRVIKADT